MLSLAFSLSFWCFGVGVVYADDGLFQPATVTIHHGSDTYSPHFSSAPGTSLVWPYSFFLNSAGIYFVFNYFDLENATFSIDPIPVNISRTGLDFQDLSFSMPFEFNLGSILYDGNTNQSNMGSLPLSAYFAGTAVVDFSDGTSKTITLTSDKSISFSAKKDNRSNQFLLSSEDFNLASEDAALASDNVGLSSQTASFSTKNADFTSRKANFNSSSASVSTKVALLDSEDVKISSEEGASISSVDSYADISGTISGRSGKIEMSSGSNLSNYINASGDTYGTGSLKMGDNSVTSNDGVNGTIQNIRISNLAYSLYGSISSFSLSGASLAYAKFSLAAADFALSSGTFSLSNGNFSFSKGTFNATGNFFGEEGEFTGNAGQLGVSEGSLTSDNSTFTIAEKGVIDEAPVTLQASEDFISVIGFTITGGFYFNPIHSPSNISYETFDGHLGVDSALVFSGNVFFTYGEAENIVAHIAGTLDDIYYTLRYDLPLSIRHLLIPTAEEVSDVIDDAVQNIEDNAGGLGQAVTAVNNDIQQFQNILNSGKAGSLKIPAAVVNVNNQQYKLWEEFDVSPYFQLQPIKDIISYVVPFLEFLIAGFVIYQFYYMWISLLSGNSYFAFIRSVKELNDEE